MTTAKLHLSAHGASTDDLVEIDGHNITKAVRNIVLIAGANELTTLHVDLVVREDVTVTGEVTVTIPEQTRAALIALGWTPPGDPGQADGEPVAPVIPDDLLFSLLKTVRDLDSLDITDEEIRDGHHRIEWYAWLAEQAYRLGQESRTTATPPAGPIQP